MLTITGKPVYGAISIGPLALFHRNTISTAARTITDPEAEVQRFQSAREEAAAQLGQLYEKALETVKKRWRQSGKKTPPSLRSTR